MAVEFVSLKHSFRHKHPHRITNTPNARSMVMRVLRREGGGRGSLVLSIEREWRLAKRETHTDAKKVAEGVSLALIEVVRVLVTRQTPSGHRGQQLSAVTIRIVAHHVVLRWQVPGVEFGS